MTSLSSRARKTRHALVAALIAVVPSTAGARQDGGPYARIAVLRAHDGQTVDFEAGYIRHLEFHRQAKDPWRWFGWTVWAGNRQRWFVYATFGHPAADFDNAVSPAEDERDNVLNVTPHAQFVENALYEFLPAISRGASEPSPAPRVELTTVDLRPGTTAAFEAALTEAQPALKVETLWYRLAAGGRSPRYVRLRPHASVSMILTGQSDAILPEAATRVVGDMTVEILNLRPTMSHGLSAPP